jgi:hypothetical protein
MASVIRHVRRVLGLAIFVVVARLSHGGRRGTLLISEGGLHSLYKIGFELDAVGLSVTEIQGVDTSDMPKGFEEGRRAILAGTRIIRTWRPWRQGRRAGLRSIAVSEPKFVEFKPRWMRQRTDADRILDDTPSTGSLAEVSPGINVRLLPIGGSHTLSARTISEAIGHTQALVQYAGNDECHGFNPDFADLRSLSAEVDGLTRLVVEPFEPGSFIIPTRLDANPLTVQDTEGLRTVTAEDVVRRFDEILTALRQPSSSVQVSIGAIQVVESLGRVIRREAEAIEFSSFDSLGRPSGTLRVDEDYVGRVNKVRESRRPTRATLETLEGQVTALDIREGKLQLSIEGRKVRVAGSFTMMFLPSLLESLGRRVRLQGLVEWRRNRPFSIQVMDAELLGDDR